MENVILVLLATVYTEQKRTFNMTLWNMQGMLQSSQQRRSWYPENIFFFVIFYHLVRFWGVDERGNFQPLLIVCQSVYSYNCPYHANIYNWYEFSFFSKYQTTLLIKVKKKRYFFSVGLSAMMMMMMNIFQNSVNYNLNNIFETIFNQTFTKMGIFKLFKI